MAIRHTSDSLTRCDPNNYSNFYDAGKRVNVRQEPVTATQPINKDTLEISRDQLKKEALNRLRHTSKYMIFQTGFMRVGKYLFLAVAFPPYFVIYGMPKWILVRGLPAIMTICTTVAEKVKQKVKKRIEVVQQKVRQAVLSMQQLVQRLIRPIVRLALDIGQAFHRMRQTAHVFVKQVLMQIKSRLNKINQAMQLFKRTSERVGRLGKRLQERVQNGKRVVQEWATTRLNHVKASFNWIAQIPQWGEVQLQRLSGRFESVGQKWKEKLEVSSTAARKGTEWLAKQAERGKQGIAKLLNPLSRIYQQALQPTWRHAFSFLRGQRLRFKGFCGQKKQRALQFLQQGQEKLKQVSYQQTLDWLCSISRFASWPAFLQLIIQKVMGNSLFQLIFKGSFKAGASCLVVFLKGFGFLINNVSQVFQFFRNGLKTLFHSIQSAISLGTRFVARGIGIGNSGIKKGVYGSLLFMIMLSIICAWGFQLLGDLMQKLSKAIPFKSTKVAMQDE